MAFKIGQKVTWWSGANGGWTKKTGTVAEIVPSGSVPQPAVSSLSPRNHESYVVAVNVGATGKAKPKLYWPRVSALVKV